MVCTKGSISRLTAAILSATTIALAASLVSPYRTPEAGANGFTVPIAAGVSGPYSYVVGIWPPDPSVGNLHMAVTLTADSRPVTDADVTVTGRAVDSGTVAGPWPAMPIFHPWTYELNLDLTKPGEWTFEIEINSSLGKTVVEAPLEVAGDQEAPLEVAGDQETAGQVYEKTLATIRAEKPSPQATAQQAAGGQEATGKAPTNLSKQGQRSVETLEGGLAVTGDTPEDGGISWAFLTLPIAILALALATWLYRRTRSPKKGTS